MTYTIKGTYEDSSGKFSQIYGNVILIDCNYIVDQVIDEMFRDLEASSSSISWQLYYEIYGMLTYINAEVKQSGFTFCSLAFEMVGVLTDQSSYYLGKYEEIMHTIEGKGAEISFALGLQTNVTITAPLET